jgi:chorismate mutase
MACFGIRGAVDVPRNEAAEILAATQTLLKRLVAENKLRVEDIASVIFTATPDLDAAAPAQAAREMGWTNAALLCVQEMRVQGALPRCIRVLMQVNGKKPSNEVRHVYIGTTRSLRPDWAQEVST